MLDNLNLSGSTWTGLLVCPNQTTFDVTLSFSSSSGTNFDGSFTAVGRQKFNGTFTASRIGDTVTMQAAVGGAQGSCVAGLAEFEGSEQFVLSGLVTFSTGGTPVTTGVLALFTRMISPVGLAPWTVAPALQA